MNKELIYKAGDLVTYNKEVYIVTQNYYANKTYIHVLPWSIGSESISKLDPQYTAILKTCKQLWATGVFFGEFRTKDFYYFLEINPFSKSKKLKITKIPINPNKKLQNTYEIQLKQDTLKKNLKKYWKILNKSKNPEGFLDADTVNEEAHYFLYCYLRNPKSYYHFAAAQKIKSNINLHS